MGRPFPRAGILFASAVFTLSLCSSSLAQSTGEAASPAEPPPATWIDKDTGHRVWRLTDEPNSSGLYFNVNAYTPDGKTVVYLAPDGFHGLDLATRKTRLILAKEGVNHSATINMVGRKTNSVFFTRNDPDSDPAKKIRALCKVDTDTGTVTQLAVLPAGVNSWDISINADETLAAGMYEEGPPAAGSNYDPRDWKPALGADGKPLVGGLVQGANKMEMMERRLHAQIPSALFTVNLQTGKLIAILHTTAWIDHFLFSPADPSLLMYAHEGLWQEVDRMWFIHADGTGNTLVHQREMVNEINGHEFWNLEGKTAWYDLQTPAGLVYWLAGYNTETHERTRFHLERSDYSIHYNVAEGETLFCGDGSDPGQGSRSTDAAWIKLFRPRLQKAPSADQPGLIRIGTFQTERLVNMAKHDYRLEPNVRFTPDKKMVLFTSNLFGPSYYFGVEVAKAAPDPAEAAK